MINIALLAYIAYEIASISVVYALAAVAAEGGE